jgi:hypothetical protein
MTATCPICETTIILIPDGSLRFCECKALGVDHTKEYTRYIGIIPKEEPEFENWWKKNNELCLKYRNLIKDIT